MVMLECPLYYDKEGSLEAPRHLLGDTLWRCDQIDYISNILLGYNMMRPCDLGQDS